jgi:hypothetical protein
MNSTASSTVETPTPNTDVSDTSTPPHATPRADAPPTEVEQKALLAKFNSTVSEFTAELKTTFPELKDTIEERYDTLAASDGSVLEWFVEHAARPHHLALTTKDNKIFKQNDAMFLLPDINFSLLWKCKLTKANKAVIWKYLHVLLLLVSHMQLQHAAASASCGGLSGAPSAEAGDVPALTPEAEEAAAKMQETFRQWGNMLDGQKLTEAEMQNMRMHADSMMKLMQSLSEPDTDGGGTAAGDEEQSSESSDEEGSTDASGGDGETTTKPDPAAFAEKIKNDPFMKQLETSNIAKFAQELSSELSMEDLGLSADAKLDSFQDVFGALGKNPNGLMGLVQSVGNKIQNKMQSGDLKQTDLVAEAHTLMQSMQGSSALKEMMQAMGGAGGRKGRRKGRGKGGSGSGGIPGFNPQQLFQTVAKQMQNFQPSPADMAAMQQMMQQQQHQGGVAGAQSAGVVSSDQQHGAGKCTSTNNPKKKRKGKKGRKSGSVVPPPCTEAALASEQLD